jgi:hypothetical protein
VKESVRNQILSEFTAFVCVEQELLDGKYSEIKNTGQISVLLENPKPIEEEYEDESMAVRPVANKKMAMKSMAMKSLARSSAPRQM